LRHVYGGFQFAHIELPLPESQDNDKSQNLSPGLLEGGYAIEDHNLLYQLFASQDASVIKLLGSRLWNGIGEWSFTPRCLVNMPFDFKALHVIRSLPLSVFLGHTAP